MTAALIILGIPVAVFGVVYLIARDLERSMEGY